MNCELFRRFQSALLDGELAPAEQIGFEEHAIGCDACRQELAALRSLKSKVAECFENTPCPSSVRLRFAKQLHKVGNQRLVEQEHFWGRLFRRGFVPVAAFAGLLFLLYARHNVSGSSVQQASMVEFPTVADVQRLHRYQLPMDVSQPEKLTPYFRDKLPFPVHPIVFQKHGLTFAGARFATVAQKPAATLYYDSGGRRITVLLSERLGYKPQRAKHVKMKGREIYYFRHAGRTLSVLESDGITYTVTADLSPRELLRLAAEMQMR